MYDMANLKKLAPLGAAAPAAMAAFQAPNKTALADSATSHASRLSGG